MGHIIKKIFMPKRTIFDFDNTLFDTEQLKDWMRQFAMDQDCTSEEAREVYEQARTDGNGTITMSIDNFIHALQEFLIRRGGLLEESAVRGFKDWFKRSGKELLFPGAEDLLERARKNSSNYLVSLGVAAWQKEKADLVKLERFIPAENMIFTSKEDGGKVEALRELFGKDFDGADTVFFNDRAEESASLLQAFPKLEMLLVRRETRDGKEVDDRPWQELKRQFGDRIAVASHLAELSHNYFSYDTEFRGSHSGRR
jgi:FMN phosphatase YigB (HAD superfamily)